MGAPYLFGETGDMTYPTVQETLEGLDTSRAKKYESYFDSIRPTTKEDKIRRGLFALASVHTTWELNCALYAELWDLKWMEDIGELRARIIESRAGLVNNRVKSISAFVSAFQQFPDFFERDNGENWYAYRDRIQENVRGLGPAKSAFFAELMYFHDNRVPCMDTHMLQAYGIAPKDVGNVKPVEMARMEMHWDLTCEKMGLNPVTARWIMWDQKQDKPDSRYWSHVLEGEPKVPGVVQTRFKFKEQAA